MNPMSIVESSDGFRIAVIRLVAASPDRCFAAWTDPVLLDGWFTHGSAVDLRVGGAYSNGDNDRGTYLVVDGPAHLRFTWEQPEHKPGSEVDLTFEAMGDGTQVTLTHSMLQERADAEDLLDGGWSWAMDSFKSFVETGERIPYKAWTGNGMPV